jgi:hypothetical protein
VEDWLYETYHEAVKSWTTMLVVDSKDDDPRQKALPPCSLGHKYTKADLAREASTLALSQTLENIMADSQAAWTKGTRKRGRICHLPQPHQRGH